jgi:hypothetical protein
VKDEGDGHFWWDVDWGPFPPEFKAEMEKFNPKIWLGKADYILQMQETDRSPCLGAFKLAVRLIAENSGVGWIKQLQKFIATHEPRGSLYLRPSRRKSIMIQEEFSLILVQYILLPISQRGDPRAIEIRLTVFYVFSYSRKGGLRNVKDSPART